MNIKKTLLGILLAVVILLPVISFVRPKPAEADFTGVIDSAKWVWEKIEVVYDEIQDIVGAQLANETLKMYMNTLSHDIATELATGGPGGKPQFRVDSIKKSLQKAQDAAIGEFLGELTNKSFAELGINLCDPSLDVKLTATLALVDEQAPPEPACDWRDVQRKWKNFATDFTDPNDPFGGLTKVYLDPSGGGQKWNTFWKSFSLEQSDLGVYSKINERAKELEQEAKEVKTAEQIECQGYIDKGTTVTGQVKTHCSAILNLSEAQFQASIEATQDQLKIAQREKATRLSDIIKQAASNFMNTFTSKLLHNYIQKGMWSLFGQDRDIYSEYKSSLLVQLRGGGNILQPRGQDIFQEFKKVSIEPISDYSFLESFAICPAQADFRQPDNCVMNASFLQAITARKTIQEAIDEGIINGDASLIGPDDILRNNSDDCYRDAFCYHNLIKLRKANIIPIGWEMAAARSSVTDPVTLQEAIDCFEDPSESNCEYAINPDYDNHNPFYHLIDGDWVLKAPQVLCEAFVYSSALESSESSSRQQNCVDAKFCLREDDSGNCLDNQYGYCTKTENIWRFGADICKEGEIYSGCLTFDNEDIGSNSYIEGSLDYCTSDEAGCKRYSQDLSFDGQWILTDIASDDDDLFLNRRTTDCTSDEAGCSEYIVLSPDRGINSIPNGDFEQDYLNNASNIAGADGIPDGWSNAGLEYDGHRIAVPYTFGGGFDQVREDIVLLPNTTYVLSASAAQYVPGDDDTARVVVSACDITGNCGDYEPPTSFNLASPVDGIGTCLTGVEATGHTQNIDLRWQPGDNMERNFCTFTTNEYTFAGVLNILGLTDFGEDHEIWFDDLKLEVVSSANNSGTTYSPYGDGGRIVMNGDRFMCTADEVGCQGYTPLNGDPMIPAVISQEDLCPAECVGYATFTQQLDYFDIIEGNLDIAYENFIPDTAIQCPLQAVGCEEFTNLDEVAQGGEGREYYTYLRQCVLENNPNAKSYFTWEGNDVAGYQIKTWFALESDIDDDPTGTDAPCTNIEPGSNVCSDAAGEVAACHTDTPGDPTDDIGVDPNCREFFDEDNDSYFRLQDRIIFASNDCHDYRRSLTTQGYKAIPSLSTACSAAELGCREYYGNTANNIRNIFNDDFENGTFSPWSGDNLDISNESLSNNGHSMKVDSTDPFGRDILNDNISNQKSYQLSWWMKGDEHINSIDFSFLITDPDGVAINDVINTDNFRNIEGGNWHYYSVSHYIDIDNFDKARVIVATIDSGGDVYFDNIMLKEVSDSVSVIKDSWITPLSCNLPDELQHLGCQAYVDTNNNTYNLKSFTRLCREEAIGCTAVIDTHNSTNPFEQTFNPSYCSDPIFTTQGTCEGADEVWINEYSEITVPDDNIDYLVPDSGKYCNTEYKGCQMLGLPVRGGEEDEFYTVYKINNPDDYNSILCIGDALMCEEFQSDKGTYYFKDPVNNTCTYQKNVLAIYDEDPFDEFEGSEQMFDGWWLSDTIDTENPLGCSDGQNSDEPGVFDSFDDISSSDTIAALCPQSKNLCTGFRDPADPIDCDPTIEGRDGECSDINIFNKFDCEDADEIWTPACQIYYYYNNENIDESSCNGIVDRNSGCILLYETNNWDADHQSVITLYDTDDTYEQNIAENRPVSPIVCPDFDINCENTSNVLVKVSKDRQCAEWLSCKSAAASMNEDTGEYSIICDKLGVCDEYDSENNITKCSNWKTDEELLALETNIYQSRTTGPAGHLNWEDLDYTGMSVPNLLPIDSLITLNFSTSTDEADSDSRLVFDACNWYEEGVWELCFPDPDEGNRLKFGGCEGIPGNSRINDGVPCDMDHNFQHFYGTCWDQTCWINPRLRDNIADNFKPETRGYATPDSPFPKSISPDGAGENRLQAYSKANICENGILLEGEVGENNGCEEIYKKVTFGNSQNVRYYPDTATIPSGICTSGDTSVEDCSANVECDSEAGRFDGRCEIATKKELVYNWSGICLEQDLSSNLVDDHGGTYNCNQWYPVQKIQGTNSLFDNYVDAGYYSPSGEDALFCAVSEPYTLPEKRTYCAAKRIDAEIDHCTLLIEVPAGTRVHLDMAENYGDIIMNGYLNTATRTKYLQSDGGVINEDLGTFYESIPDQNDPGGSWGDDDGDLETALDGGFGLDFIEKIGAGPDPAETTAWNSFPVGNTGFSSLFNSSDFCREGDLSCNSTSPMPIIPFSGINDIFYPNPEVEGNLGIRYFYYDEHTKWNGETSWRAGIPLPRPPSKVLKTYTCRGGCDDDCGPQTSCGAGWHEAKYRQNYQGRHCGWGGPRRHYRWRYCNPLSYNIYLEADLTEETWVCSETDCSDEQDLGWICLEPVDTIYEKMLNDADNNNGLGTPWSWIEPRYDIDHPDHPFPDCLTELECDDACDQCQIDCPDCPLSDCLSEVNNCVERPTSTVAAMPADDDSLCYNNPNCEFVHCVDNLTLSGHNDVYDENGNLLDGIDYCSDYGGIEYEFNNNGTPDDPTDDFLDPIGIQGCWNRIFMLGGGDNYTVIPAPIDEDIIIDESLPLDTLEVSDPLLDQIGDCLFSDINVNCANPYKVGHCEDNPDIQCGPEIGGCPGDDECTAVTTGLVDYDSCYLVVHKPGGIFTWWVELVCPEAYLVRSEGTSCSFGSVGANGCYQQCSLVTQLDFLGNNSWVRTDIWHRSHELYPDRRVFDEAPNIWTSYYYNNSPSIEYKLGSEIFIEGLITPGEQTNFNPYSPFGAAWGSPANEAVVTRVPIAGSSYSDLSAATFFAIDSTPDNAPSDSNWDNAADRLLYLFAHAYNFVWTNEAGDYEELRDRYLPHSDLDIYGDVDIDWVDNPYAKEDYPPQILKVCNGNELCKIYGDESISVESGITLNNLNETEDHAIGQGSLFTGLKFFYHAHPDHMPIINIEVDWKDSNAGFVSNPGRYKNSMESCNPGEAYFQTTSGDVPIDSIQGFGGETQACRQGYKVFYYDYSYNPDFLCGEVPDSPDFVNASCYKPVVRVTDRWGRFNEEAFDGWVVIRRE